NAALCYDGIMIPKNLCKTKNELKNLITEIQDKITKIIGIKLKLINKPLKLKIFEALEKIRKEIEKRNKKNNNKNINEIPIPKTLKFNIKNIIQNKENQIEYKTMETQTNIEMVDLTSDKIPSSFQFNIKNIIENKKNQINYTPVIDYKKENKKYTEKYKYIKILYRTLVGKKINTEKEFWKEYIKIPFHLKKKNNNIKNKKINKNHNCTHKKYHNSINSMFNDENEEIEQENDNPDKVTKEIFNNILNKRLIKWLVNKLHPAHPFRTLKYAPQKWKPFEILHSSEIKNINTSHWNRYQKLFYNFNRITEKY
ncbi:MAG: hypothetical protein GY755_14935, partial [Chloroflexi bacterium]|nr:hypothetical protein [Chloroflexota bacterium]